MAVLANPVYSTAVIDNALAAIAAVRAALGQGPPECGEAYRESLQRLDGIVTYILDDSACLWDGAAGAICIEKIEGLGTAIELLADIDRGTVDVISLQAEGVRVARNGLHAISTELEQNRQLAQMMAAAGNFAASVDFQERVAARALDNVRTVARMLHASTAENAFMLERSKDRTWALCMRVQEVRSTPSVAAGTIVTVEPRCVMFREVELASCALGVGTQVGVGTQLFEKVQLTHGRSPMTEAFSVQLAGFVAMREMVLISIRDTFSELATILTEAAARYERCDAAAADAIENQAAKRRRLE